MPKILINERDRTSSGASNSYANYAVLIVGFAGTATNPTIEPDSNGVYLFNTAQDFKDTIGLRAPKIKGENDQVTFYHYGNQMAYELLNLGYSIVFKPIKSLEDTKDENGNVQSYGVTNEKFWEIFKDKVNYDFRFITHGFLESSDLSEDANYSSYKNRKNLVVAAQNRLAEILALATEEYNKQPETIAEGEDEGEGEGTNDRLELSYFTNKLFNIDVVAGTYQGFIDQKTDSAYGSYEEATKGTKEELETLEAYITSLTDKSVAPETIVKLNSIIAKLATYAPLESVGNDFAAKETFGRGDCIALIELDENSYVNSKVINPEVQIIEAINAENLPEGSGKYCAMTVPSVYYKMAISKEKVNAFDNNTKFPGAFHYLACFMHSLQLGFSEWYAAAGYTRGISSYMVDRTSVKLGEIAINALEPRNYDDPQKDYPKFACNVIANFRGSYYLWGNRTAQPLGKKGSLDTGDLVASSFLNIRQLCTTIKKQLYTACRMFTFDPNSDTLWVNFTNAIKPTLEAMKADQGIRDYKILKVYTPTKATLKAKIRIIPIEAVEDFDLEVSLEDSFGETAAIVTE